MKTRYESFRRGFEIADVGFFLLRIVAIAGTIAWILLAPVPRETVRTFLLILVFFVSYGVLIYGLLFLRFDRKREIYKLSFLFDVAFVYLLILNTGGYASSFFVGFFLLTALHSFYYGHPAGLLAAAVCAAVYWLAGRGVSAFVPVDYLLKSSFLFLIALPIGLLSGLLRREKDTIESLNAELLRSMESMRHLQGRLVEVEKLSALGRLTASVAHEIRNPLTVIGGFAKRLEKLLPEGTREKGYARTVASEVARLERILRDTLTFSREAKFHLRHTDLNELVARTGEEYAEICREKGIVLSVRPSKNLARCIADDDQIRMALANLVTNAIDAMGGGGTLTLSTRMVCDNGVYYVVIDVTDTGPGVPPDLVNRIFEPFYSTKAVGHGTGLGLSMCKKIMEEHRGSARVSSAPGKGAVFSLYIPYVPAEETFKVQCWEVIRCGVESKERAGDRCPAYPNFGRICWSVAGTKSETRVWCPLAEKIGDCRKCAFYELLQPMCPEPGAGNRGDPVVRSPG